MKKIFTYICAAVLALGLASCAKEDIATPEETGKMTIIATLEEAAETKTTLVGDDQKGYKVVWEEGDEIYVIYNNYAQSFTLTSGAGTTTAEFTCKESLPDGTYDAYFGIDYYKGKVPTLPESYNSLISRSFTPMKATLTVDNGVASVARFKNLLGLLRLDLTGYGELRDIIVQTEKLVSGPFDVDSEGNAIVHDRTARAFDYVGLNLGYRTVYLSDNVQSFYLPLPKGDYSSVKIRFEGPAIGLCEMTLNSGKTLSIKRSEIYPISFNVNITKGEIRREGSSTRVKWVQLWENGPKWAPYNLGVEDGKPESYGDYYKLPFEEEPTKEEWGPNWRTPTKEELSGLISNKCTSELTTINGVKGRKFTGKGIFSENSIFLPFAGYDDYYDGKVAPGSMGAYRCSGWIADWSWQGGTALRMTDKKNDIYNFFIEEDELSVRPVVND